MTTTTAEHVVTGQPARYHGSLAAQHGPVTVLGICDCDDCFDAERVARLTGAQAPADRYELLTASGRVLSNVRRESFTPVPTA